MKDIQNFINEVKYRPDRSEVFTVAFNDFVDKEGLPIGVDIYVEPKYSELFKKFGEKQEGDIFAHFADEDCDVCY